MSYGGLFGGQIEEGLKKVGKVYPVGAPVTNPDLTAEFSKSVVAINEQILKENLPRDSYRDIWFRGMKIGQGKNKNYASDHYYDLESAVTDAHFSLSNDQVGQITLTIEDPHLTMYNNDIFVMGAEISYHGVAYIVSAVALSGGSSNLGGVTVTARSKIIQDLKDRQGTLTMDSALTSDFVVSELTAVGATYIVQETKRKSVIKRDVAVPGVLYAREEQPSTWTTMVRMAEGEGYTLFECYGVVFYCKPSWLYSKMLNYANSLYTGIGVYWRNSASVLGAEAAATGASDKKKVKSPRTANVGAHIGDDNLIWIQAMGVPSVDVSYDQAQGPNWTVTVETPLELANRFFLGQRFIIRGTGGFNEAANLLVSGIDYSLAGTANAKITATTPYDPVPPADTTAKNGALTSTSVGAVKIPAGKYGGSSFDAKQLDYAVQICAEVLTEKLTWKDAEIAITTVLTESTLHMYANKNNPDSLKLPHDAVGSDHGSVGLYQQQVGGAANSTANWGTTAECMDVVKSTQKFLKALLAIDRRSFESNTIGQNCQQVQGSAVPDAYNGWVTQAKAIVVAIYNATKTGTSATSGVDGWRPGRPIGTKRAADFVNIALRQVGKPYTQNTPPSLKDVPTSFDCSLIIQWSAYQVGIHYPRSTFDQVPYLQSHGGVISVAEALRTRGAVLYHPGHAGISLGVNGKTEEGYDYGVGVIINSPTIRGYHWSIGGRIPGMIYD